VLAGRHGGAVDLGCDTAFPVRATRVGKTRELALRLGPAEGTVVRVDK
jgi:hypothetical protein